MMRRVGVVVAAVLLAGCANVAARQAADATDAFAVRELGVSARLHESTADRAAASQRANALLAQRLTADAAVSLALDYSPVFQQLLAERSAATAAATQSARLPNPLVSYARLAGGDVTEIDRALRVSLLDIVLWPQRRRLADLQRAQVRLRSAMDVVNTATAARRAWVDAVAARQSLAYAEQTRRAAESTAELARRMAAVGNLSRIEQAREHVFYADATALYARAQLDVQRTREALVRVLGLSRDQALQLQLPDRLPDLPATPEDESVLARRALAERLDVELARAELDFTARSLGLTRVTSSVNAFEVAAQSNSVPEGGEALTGYELEARLPLFDFGDARRRNARALYLAALNRSAAVMVNAESGLREGYQGYRTAYDLARHYRDEVVPLRQVIAEENQLRYNGMLISVFELLADAREQMSSVRQAIAAQRDFWLADATLRSTLIGVAVSGGGVPTVAGADAARD